MLITWKFQIGPNNWKLFVEVKLKNVEVTKAVGSDQISEKVIKDGTRILAKPSSKLCNLSMT